MATPQNQSFANATATGTLSVSGQTTCGNVTCSNLSASSANIAGSCNVDGDLVSGGTISGTTGFFSSTLTAFGASQLQAVDAVSLHCTANVSVMGTLQAYGPSVMESITGTSLTVEGGTTTNGLTANSLTANSLTATTGTVTNLTSSNANVTTLNTTTGTASSLTSTTGNIGTLNTTTCSITNLTSGNVTCNVLSSNSYTTPVQPLLNHKISGLVTLMSDSDAWPTTPADMTICGLQMFRNKRAQIGELDFLCQARLGASGDQPGGGFDFWAANATSTPVLQAYIAPDGVHAVGNLYHGVGGNTNLSSQINDLVAKSTSLSYANSITSVSGEFQADVVKSNNAMISNGYQMSSALNYSTFLPPQSTVGYNTWVFGVGTTSFTEADETNGTVWSQISISLPVGVWRIDACLHYGLPVASTHNYLIQMCVSPSTAFTVGSSKQFPVSQLIPRDIPQNDSTLTNTCIYTLTATTTTLYMVCRLARNFTGSPNPLNLTGVLDWAKSGLIATRLC